MGYRPFIDYSVFPKEEINIKFSRFLELELSSPISLESAPLYKFYIFKVSETVFNKSSVKFSWQSGDCMLLDNYLMAHGRSPYAGERKVVVAMG